jgi:hypothetical protein
MALVNAFAEIATEATMRKILSAVTYAKDGSDQLRVSVVDSLTSTILGHPRNDSTNGVNGQTQAWFGPGTVFMVDEREQQRVQSEQQFNQVRTQRWSFS